MPKTIATTPSWYWPDGVPRVLGVPPRSVWHLAVDVPARRAPDRPALVHGGRSVPAAELGALVAAVAAGVEGAATGPGAVAVCAGPSPAGVLAVLGALAADRPAVLVEPGADASEVACRAQAPAVAVGDADGVAALAGTGAPLVEVGALVSGGVPATGPPAGHGQRRAGSGLDSPSVCLTGRSGPVWHSQRSLLAGALALQAFARPASGAPWLIGSSPCAWDGLCATVCALVAGAPLLTAPPGAEACDATERHRPTWMVSSLAVAADSWAGAGRRRGPAAGGWLLAGVDGPFDPDERRAVAAATGAGVLTVFGMAETGPVLASHPSWFLDEAVGIPVPNMHVVPADPDTGEPVDAMWELLDRAMVSVWSPSLAVGGLAPGPGDPAGRRFVTGALAASDPNGMLYLVDE